MKFNKKYKIEPGFESLFEFKSKEEENEHEAKMLMFRFFSELEKLNSDKPVKKKELAKIIGTSPSFVTQLYQGDKLINLTTLAKLQEAYGITFEIKAVPNSVNYAEEVKQAFNAKSFYNKVIEENGFWVFVNKTPDYYKDGEEVKEGKYSMKVA